MPPLTSNDERIILYLMEADADEVVDMLGISTAELLKRFPEKVSAYIRQELSDGADEEEESDYY
jgi:ABC-type molybdate transport system ATPase subunit